MFQAIYEGFIEGLKGEFPDIPLAKSYPTSGKMEHLPLIVVESPEFYPTRNGLPNDGTKEFVTRWDVRHFIDKHQEHDADYAARDVAMRIATLFSDKVFTDYTYPCECLGASDDNLDFDLPYEVWLTEFQVKVRAGESDMRSTIIGFGG